MTSGVGAGWVSAATVVGACARVEADRAVTCGGLAQRDHQLAARHAAAAALDRRGTTLDGQLGVDELDQPRAAHQLADAHQPGKRRQALVVGAKRDPSGRLSP